MNLTAGWKSKYHIDAMIREDDGFEWRFTGIYGEPKAEEREQTWRLMRTLKHQSDKPWICMGDFNEILLACEKEGGAPRPQAQMDRFKVALEFCDQHDLGFTGDPFTWRNHSHDATKYIRERLDRAVATDSWCTRFPGFKVTNDNPRHSDHRPVVVATDDDNSNRGVAGPRPFRSEAKWMEEDGCDTIVENAWLCETQGRGGDVVSGLKGVANDLQDWSKNTLGNLDKRIARLKKDLESSRRREISRIKSSEKKF